MCWKRFLFVAFLLITLSLMTCINPVQAFTLYPTSEPIIIGNENYTVNAAMDFDIIMYDTNWIRFNTIDFNITSSNPINITLYNLNSNPLTASTGDTIVRFTADTSGGTVYFNISGLDNHTAYQVFRDNVKVSDLTANTSGGISFTGTSWSSHTYTIKEGSNYVKITYEHSGLANTYEKGFTTISLIGTVMTILAIGVVVTVLMLLKRRS